MIVCDTGPLLHLSEAGAIHLLPQAGETLIPSLVAIEFEANAQGWRPPHWVKIVDLEKSMRKKAEKWVRERTKLTVEKRRQLRWLCRNMPIGSLRMTQRRGSLPNLPDWKFMAQSDCSCGVFRMSTFLKKQLHFNCWITLQAHPYGFLNGFCRKPEKR